MNDLILWNSSFMVEFANTIRKRWRSAFPSSTTLINLCWFSLPLRVTLNYQLELIDIISVNQAPVYVTITIVVITTRGVHSALFFVVNFVTSSVKLVLTWSAVNSAASTIRDPQFTYFIELVGRGPSQLDCVLET
jgi:hypothetical protein